MSCLRCNDLHLLLQELRQTGKFSTNEIKTLDAAIGACERCWRESGVNRYGEVAAYWRQAKQQLVSQLGALVDCAKWSAFLDQITEQLVSSMSDQEDAYAATRLIFNQRDSNDFANYLLYERGSCTDPRKTRRAELVAAVLLSLHNDEGGWPEAQNQLQAFLEFEALEKQHAIESLPSVPMTGPAATIRSKSAVAI